MLHTIQKHQLFRLQRQRIARQYALPNRDTTLCSSVYGGPDVEFATRLNDALRIAGVKTFLFAEDAIPGEPIHHMVPRAVYEHDRVLLICSRDSLDRNGVRYEMEVTLAREASEGRTDILMPLSIDDYLISDWKPENRDHLPRLITVRAVSDFSNVSESDELFDAKVRQLLKAIESDAT